MAFDDQGSNLGLLWENQSLDMPTFDMNPQNQQKGQAIAVKKRNRGGRKEKKNVVDADSEEKDDHHKVHIWNERERRKKMRNMFDTLQGLLPQLPFKAEKSTIIVEAVSYIKCLQETLKKLEKRKQEKLQSAMINIQLQSYDSIGSSNSFSMAIGTSQNLSGSSNTAFSQPTNFQTWSYKNIVMNIIGLEAQFCVSAPRKQSTFTTIAFVLEKYQIEVVSANIVCNGNTNVYLIIAQARGSYMLQDAKLVAKIYRQAAGEIQLFIA